MCEIIFSITINQVDRHKLFVVRYFFSLLFFLCLISMPCFAGYFPGDGYTLHYRLVGFETDSAPNIQNYKLEIAAGTYLNESDFNGNILVSRDSRKSLILAEVPYFNKAYTWRISVTDRSGKTFGGSLHHFNTGYTSYIDSSAYRLRIITPSDSYKGYVFLDNQRVLYDMKGNPVWYLPVIANVSDENVTVRDLKITPQGTITFIGARNIPYEISYNGTILWQGPNTGRVSGSGDEHYHHEFTRLSNGHYMVLGTEIIAVPSKDEMGNAVNSMTPMSTIIEYDSSGSVMWTWKTSKYFRESDLVNYKPEDGSRTIDFHENSFFFDESGKVIYLSFKNISRIVKIRYPSGKVIGMIGSKIKQGRPLEYNGLFCGQHSCKYSQIGCLFLYNNNGCSPGNSSKVKMLKEEPGKIPAVRKVWEYECLVEDGYPREAQSGGNVQEMSNNAAFVSMGGAYSKVFIVNMDKKELWAAMPEKWISEERKWTAVSQYRASIIENKAEIERLIWNRRGRKSI